MLAENHQIVREILGILERECALQSEYTQVLALERQALKNFKPQEIEDLAQKRGKITERIAELQEKRLQIITDNGGSGKRLTEWAKEQLHSKDCERVVKLAAKLKAAVEMNSKFVSEFKTILDFSVGMVSSTLSIIWSGTQTVNDTYSGSGELKRSFQPAAKKSLNLLTTA